MKKIALVLIANIMLIFSNLAVSDVYYGVSVPYYSQTNEVTCGAASLKMWLCHENSAYGNSNCYKSIADIYAYAHTHSESGWYVSPLGAKATMTYWGVRNPYNWEGYNSYDSGGYWQAQSLMWNPGSPVMASVKVPAGVHWFVVEGVQCQNYGCNTIKGVYIKDPDPGGLGPSKYLQNTSSEWRAYFQKFTLIVNQPQYYNKWLNVRKT